MNIKQLSYRPAIASAALIAALITAQPIYAGSVILNLDGTITAPVIGSVLGQSTETNNPALTKVMEKMQTEEKEILQKYQAGTLTREEVRAEKLELVDKYQNELKNAKKSTEQTTTQTQKETANPDTGTQERVKEIKKVEVEQFKSTSPRIKIDTVEGNRLQLVTLNSDGAEQTIAKENELIIKTDETEESETAGKPRDTVIRATNNHKYLITGTIAAKINTPISIDLETRAMTITTPAGTKTVAILPEQAIQKARMAANLSETVNQDWPVTAYPETETEDVLELTTMEDQPVYKVPGRSTKRFLGIIPVSIKKTVIVSAETGDLVEVEQTLFDQVLEAITI
jgi:hypothetical protein